MSRDDNSTVTSLLEVRSYLAKVDAIKTRVGDVGLGILSFLNKFIREPLLKHAKKYTKGYNGYVSPLRLGFYNFLIDILSGAKSLKERLAIADLTQEDIENSDFYEKLNEFFPEQTKDGVEFKNFKNVRNFDAWFIKNISYKADNQENRIRKFQLDQLFQSLVEQKGLDEKKISYRLYKYTAYPIAKLIYFVFVGINESINLFDNTKIFNFAFYSIMAGLLLASAILNPLSSTAYLTVVIASAVLTAYKPLRKITTDIIDGAKKSKLEVRKSQIDEYRKINSELKKIDSELKPKHSNIAVGMEKPNSIKQKLWSIMKHNLIVTVPLAAVFATVILRAHFTAGIIPLLGISSLVMFGIILALAALSTVAVYKADKAKIELKNSINLDLAKQSTFLQNQTLTKENIADKLLEKRAEYIAKQIHGKDASEEQINSIKDQIQKYTDLVAKPTSKWELFLESINPMKQIRQFFKEIKTEILEPLGILKFLGEMLKLLGFTFKKEELKDKAIKKKITIEGQEYEISFKKGEVPIVEQVQQGTKTSQKAKNLDEISLETIFEKAHKVHQKGVAQEDLEPVITAMRQEYQKGNYQGYLQAKEELRNLKQNAKIYKIVSGTPEVISVG